MTTPHIAAMPEDLAPMVLMPGDPRRATYIAEKFLTAAREISNVRNAVAYTGNYEGRQISIVPSGMGMPSAAIYITELFRFFGVETIIRIGTAGAFEPSLELGDMVLASSCITNSSMPELLLGNSDPKLAPAPDLLAAAESLAVKAAAELRVGKIFTTDIFYEPDNDLQARMLSNEVLCVEMETAALYAIAELERKKALSVVTISDHLTSGLAFSSSDREKSLDKMIEFSLDLASAATE
ncbi:MAG: purine-nucleoside phosphorylase [Acidimicrobiaceae bacterium]|nr:purine-nucleoside phosphorylase [Acidimicrobiaceae bacterium]HAA67128.1 purine-nucleoside phosphorylase [Acidimicrobiaceae bacterium]